MSKKNEIKSEPFCIVSPNKPSGSQPEAIKQLITGLNEGKRDQVLLGVTGSGKTFTMANIIEKTQRPAVIMAHNKTLAAQLYSEMRSLFPYNAVEYFVSYYDYYQPEAYIAKTDKYIEKDSAINKQIEVFRHSTTMSLMERRDVIIVTSVSSIYGLGSPWHYGNTTLKLNIGMKINHGFFIKELTRLNYKRNDTSLDNGRFRVRGDIIYIYPSYSESSIIRIEFFGDEIEAISEYDAVTNKKIRSIEKITIYPATHYITPENVLKTAIKLISEELKECTDAFKKEGQFAKAERLDQRTRYDIEMMLEVGHFKGIENYSRYVEDRKAGEPAATLFDYLQDDTIIFVDESHATIPQIRGMYAGDRSRKINLISHGFRLPSALDNRPLQFKEWDQIRKQTIYVSATPAQHELLLTNNEVVEQIIRPTGLLDPICEVRPLENHFDDLLKEINETSEKGMRSIVIVLTKKMAEKTHAYFQEVGLKSMYIHADTGTIERIEILKMLREGIIDVIVGINLLREGIDIPECGFVAITDADKEGFLRSETSLIQIVGRAARNNTGRVIFYADKITKSIENTIRETNRRRSIQEKYNTQYNIIPTTIIKPIDTSFDKVFSNKEKSTNTMRSIAKEEITPEDLRNINIEKKINKISRAMKKAASELNFEEAAKLREKLKAINQARLNLQESEPNVM